MMHNKTITNVSRVCVYIYIHVYKHLSTFYIHTHKLLQSLQKTIRTIHVVSVLHNSSVEYVRLLYIISVYADLLYVHTRVSIMCVASGHIPVLSILQKAKHLQRNVTGFEPFHHQHSCAFPFTGIQAYWEIPKAQ